MSRRGKPRRLKGSQAVGHSATDNGWFIPSGKSVEAVQNKARELWESVDEEPTRAEYEHRPALKDARAVGRVEGMAIALAILKANPDGSSRKASEELRRIKYGKPGSKADRAGLNP
ncbi:hypothetical protein PBI_NINA_66 [Gordonia phage Nina]|uniref:Uncharacterized protein n=2 Tax=Emalynvirus cozz TaxID=2560490 RepID=A0A7M1CM77_9CAUD|nr:hypothetical protein PBI_NINA_66 [Gordonia phage Nina]QOP65324.1 hypothetical protein SEA_BURNSEY_66 [Gordonia phage Burnsey]